MPSWHQLRIRGFRALESVGVHAVPNHFYEPVPDTRKLPESTWTKPSSLAGIDMNESFQLELLAMLHGRFGPEFSHIPTSSNFGSVDSEILYSMVRQFRPRLVLEVGSGTSTQITASALMKNGLGKLIAVEPHPNKTIKKGFPGLTRLIAAPVQQVRLSEFECLEENDILFIDSSHMLKIGSDVQFLFLEVLPRLKTGVIVQVHDIFLPANYPRHWVVDDLRFWNEQYVLQAFLAFNRAFEVLWSGFYISKNYPERLELAFPSFRRGETSPGSFWMRKIC